MSDVAEFIKRASKRTGFKREFYLEKNIPSEASNVIVVPFFGDIRSTFILSSLILRSYKESNPDKYIILCSWPGMQGLFPYVDEYWSLEDESVIKGLASMSNNLYNKSDTFVDIKRNLFEVLNVLSPEDLKKLYNNGFTKKYWDDFAEIKRFLPEIPSMNLINSSFKTQLSNFDGKKIVVYPASRMRSWQNGKTEQLLISKDFWVILIKMLIKEGYSPVVYQNQFTYDISRDFAEKCLYLTSNNIMEILSAFRHIGCVLDIHTDISRLAIAARCPFLAVTERNVFIEDKDYEIDDLCADDLPRQYIYSFSTQLMVGGLSEWEVSVLGNIEVRLKDFLSTINPNNLPSTSGRYEEVSYGCVRERMAKRLGSVFINSSKRK